MEVQVETPDAQDLMSDSVMLSGRENFVPSSVPRNTRRNSRRHGKTDNTLLDKAGTILLRSLRICLWFSELTASESDNRKRLYTDEISQRQLKYQSSSHATDNRH